ncbi:MAG: glycosyltransferase [Methylovulum miyakonense]|uniref:glycosyltransferase n=1 Tax=Methylovulum miyakonense TaxID=645578 RepID=UPI003BB66DE4
MNAILNTPLVSIVIATYNGERFLNEQLDSVIQQTYKNIEIIAVDDCSTDNTLSILSDYAARHANFTVVRNGQNLGYQKNFEKGFLLAAGDYIAPCDQDDIWLPSKIETLVASIGDHAIAYCNSAFINSSGGMIGKSMSDAKTLADFNTPIMYTVGASAPSHAMLIKRQVALEAMPFPTLMSHDNWLGFVATFNSSLKFVNEVLVLYRRHENNVYGAFLKKDAKKNRLKATSQQQLQKARQRIQLFHDKCPDHLIEEKQFFKDLCKSYLNYSLANNLARTRLFFKYRKEILMHKKRNELRRWLYCLKVFFKII